MKNGFLALGLFCDENSGQITTFSRAVTGTIDRDIALSFLTQEYAEINGLEEENVKFTDILLLENGIDGCPDVKEIFHY